MRLRRVERILIAVIAVLLLALAAFMGWMVSTADAHDGCHSRACHARVLNEDRREQIRKLTPYRCATGRWAIPCAIVACESGGSWRAYNRSGARGPYQFLGWPVPWPVRNLSDKLAHHRMAARLWAGGSGASHWRECL